MGTWLHVGRWQVELLLTEDEGVTTARASLHSAGGGPLEGRGRAESLPGSPVVPEIGDEIAAARALADLSEKLLLAAGVDLQELAPWAPPPRRTPATGG